VRYCVISFTSDWLYPTSESRVIVHALNAVAGNVSFVEIETDAAMTAFLLENRNSSRLEGLHRGCARQRGFWARRFDRFARDLRLIADMVAPVAGCSTSAVPTAPCWPIWRPRRTSMAAAWN